VGRLCPVLVCYQPVSLAHLLSQSPGRKTECQLRRTGVSRLCPGLVCYQPVSLAHLLLRYPLARPCRLCLVVCYRPVSLARLPWVHGHRPHAPVSDLDWLGVVAESRGPGVGRPQLPTRLSVDGCERDSLGLACWGTIQNTRPPSKSTSRARPQPPRSRPCTCGRPAGPRAQSHTRRTALPWPLPRRVGHERAARPTVWRLSTASP